MGNGILSRSGSGDGAKIGDIRLTTRDSIGDKWALCNGDAVESGSPITKFCSFDPVNTSNWYDLSTVVTQVPNIVLYDPTDNVYWGIHISNVATESSTKMLSIYRYDRDERGQYQSVIYSTTIPAYGCVYDACFVRDEDYGNKIAFAYYNNAGEEFIIYYDINSNTCTFGDTQYNTYLGNDGLFPGYGYDTTSIANGAKPLSLAAAGRFVIAVNEMEGTLSSYDSRNGGANTPIAISTAFDDVWNGISSYASGPHHTAIIGSNTFGDLIITVVDNTTGKFIISGNGGCQYINSMGGTLGVHVSCIYEEDEDCEYFTYMTHDDSSSCYRGYLKVTANGAVSLTSNASILPSVIFQSNTNQFGSFYEFKIGDSYYGISMNTSNSNQKICMLSDKAGTVNGKTNIFVGGIYSADRNIFGYKTGASWYLLSNGYSGDIYFTIPCLPIIGEGSYNGFIKVEN